MAVVTEKAPSGIDEITGQAVCHLYDNNGTAPLSLCGVPREEQPRHGEGGSKGMPYSPWCGLPRCPACAKAQR